MKRCWCKGRRQSLVWKKKIYQRESKRFRRCQINNPPQKATAWAQNYFHDQENQLTIHKYKTFATRCKPLLITSRPHKTLTHRISKRAYKVPDKKSLGRWNQDELVQEWWEEKSLEMINNSWSDTSHIICEICGTVLLVFIDDVTVAGWTLKYTELYSWLRFSKMLQNCLGRSSCRKQIMTQSKL